MRAQLFAAGAYPGPQFQPALAKRRLPLQSEVVTRRDQSKGFPVLPKRGRVERTLAWLNRGQCLAKDFENRLR